MEEDRVKNTASLLTVLTIAMVVLVSISLSARAVKADSEYSIEHVFHTVTIMYNGYVFINDTLRVNITEQVPTDFLIGFPDRYGQSVLKCFAFAGSDDFAVSLNVPLSGRMGFYGVRVEFPLGAPQTFTVAFVLSSSLVAQDPQNASMYTLDFPAYPSFVKKADLCDVSVVAPGGASFEGGTVSGFTYSQQDLQELTYAPASLDFLMPENTSIPVAEVTKLDRTIALNGFGGIDGVDTYDVTNNGLTAIGSFDVFLPPNASDPEAVDQFGRKMTGSSLSDVNTNQYNVAFNLEVGSGESGKFYVSYSLPGSFLTQESSDSFSLRLLLFEYENYYVDQVSVTVVLPEGASVKTAENNFTSETHSLDKGVYQEIVSLAQNGVVVLNKVGLNVSYDYNPLWTSFRPTMWVWAVAVVGTVIVAVAGQRPKGPSRVPISPAALKLGPEYFRSFVDAYEEKKKIDLELDSLEARAEKGRIPRRRYKVMRRTLEARLSTVSRSLTGYKEKMRAAGGQYSGFMLQLEVAEAEISEVKTNIKNAEALHNRGELSLEAYRNRLADYQRKKERAETTINGILLRLREEVR
jgi:hypothetical protein